MLLGLAEITEIKDEDNKENGIETIEVNNFTLLNLLLLKFGPLHERNLTILVMIVQILASCLAFIIRYPLAHFFYEVS